MSSEISAQNTRNNVTLYLPQETIVKYEARMSGGKARDAWHSLHRPVKRWVFPVGDGLRMELTIYARGSEKNGPLFADAYLMKDGKVRGASDYHDGLAGAFACLDYKDNDKEYTITVLPEGNYLTIKDPSQLLIFVLKRRSEVSIGYGCEAEPQLEAHVDYRLSSGAGAIDPDTTFGVNFRAEKLSYCKTLDGPLPELEIILRWHAEAERVSMFLNYEGRGRGASYRVTLSDEVEQQLRKRLFKEAKWMYGKTPAEEWAAWKK